MSSLCVPMSNMVSLVSLGYLGSFGCTGFRSPAMSGSVVFILSSYEFFMSSYECDFLVSMACNDNPKYLCKTALTALS